MECKIRDSLAVYSRSLTKEALTSYVLCLGCLEAVKHTPVNISSGAFKIVQFLTKLQVGSQHFGATVSGDLFACLKIKLRTVSVLLSYIMTQLSQVAHS